MYTIEMDITIAMSGTGRFRCDFQNTLMNGHFFLPTSIISVRHGISVKRFISMFKPVKI